MRSATSRVRPCLAHKASHEAVACIERIAGLDAHPLDRSSIPGCTYSHPQIASIGLTERAAAAAGRQVRIGRFPLIGNGKAIAIGDSNGMVKTLFDAQTGELLGAHLVGPGVTELIHGLRDRDGHRDDRSRTDRHRVSAPDDLGGDARIGAGGVRPRAAHLTLVQASS